VARKLVRNRLALVGTAIVVAFAIAAILAPVVAPADPLRQNLRERKLPPGTSHLLGTDEFGRDMLSRVLHGARYAFLVSAASVAIAAFIGLVVGLVSGYFGGVTDEILMRMMDILLAFPYLLLALLIVAALGPGVANTVIAIGTWAIPLFARQTRAAVLEVRGREFLQAGKAIGVSDWRAIVHHVLPNIASPIVVYATLYMGYAILMESALTFLGLGIQPPTPSWAGMIAAGRAYILAAPHLATIPGLAIMLLTLGFNLLGDGLRDVLDPKRIA
jgi:peptide/nickel transport system permease protein